MAKKRSVAKESDGQSVKASSRSDVKTAQPDVSSERYTVETPKLPDAHGPGCADAGPETTGRHDADEPDAFKLQSDDSIETSRRQDDRVKLTLYLPADLARRFAVHAAMTGQDRS